MLRLILPVLLALIGVGGGVGAGLMLKPAPDPAAAEVEAAEGGEGADDPADAADVADDAGEPEPGSEMTFVKLNNQFIVPILAKGAMSGFVVLSLSLEVPLTSSDKVYALEPKLRDGFLQVMFDHANAGGFDGAFTNSTQMLPLRKALREMARKTLEVEVADVLITDIVRQDG